MKSTANGIAHKSIPLAKLKPNPNQVRQTWDDTSSIDDLASSIRNQGLLNELVVTPRNGSFIIVCGERRFRAIKKHRLMKQVPCCVREGLSEAQLFELNIVENLQREDLTPVDEANAYRTMMSKCGYTQSSLAKRLGISAAMVSYKLSLLDLTPSLQKQVASGKISETDGRVISQSVKRIENPGQRARALKNVEAKIKKEPNKLDSSTVKRLSETVVTEIAGSKALPKSRAPKASITATPKTKVAEQGSRFLSVLSEISGILAPFKKQMSTKAVRTKVLNHLLASTPSLPHKIRASVALLELLHKEASALLDKRKKASKK